MIYFVINEHAAESLGLAPVYSLTTKTPISVIDYMHGIGRYDIIQNSDYIFRIMPNKSHFYLKNRMGNDGIQQSLFRDEDLVALILKAQPL